ncbi:MAG: DUF2188 domain-containing protein [Bacteroidales bacterium]|jgi:hypothetical protein|nr:DUF2188 domain-containing protein [Bacteroidales bacterium]
MAKNIHVVHTKDIWKVKQDNVKRSSGNFETQKEAIELSRKIAINNGEELVIHRKDNVIREKHSYGNDPFPPDKCFLTPKPLLNRMGFFAI